MEMLSKVRQQHKSKVKSTKVTAKCKSTITLFLLSKHQAAELYFTMKLYFVRFFMQNWKGCPNKYINYLYTYYKIKLK